MEKLAIVVPCYNEEEVLKIASEALRGVLDDLIHKGKIAEDSFILFVNDGSKDRTWELIEEEHKAHPKAPNRNTKPLCALPPVKSVRECAAPGTPAI